MIFTVVDAALLRGLPYKEPNRLVHLWERTPKADFSKREFSYPDYQDYQQNNVFEGLAAYTGGGAILTGLGEPERIARRGRARTSSQCWAWIRSLAARFNPAKTYLMVRKSLC